MNTNLYKHIFSKRLNALVVVGENAHSAGKKAGLGADSVEKLVLSTSTMSPNRFIGLLSVGFICVSSALADPVLDVLPTNGVVVQGAASITQQTHLMTINQATDKAVINWQGFDIGHGATVNVVQPTSQSVLLNRVVGNNASQIFGTLNANGHVILVNPNGIVFGADGSVNASAFTASTLGITDADFMAGNYYFTANGSNGTIVNQGSINTNGGYVALLGASVTNDGKITTNFGNAYLGAAESILLPITNSGRIKMELSPASINAAVNNTKNGLIVTAGGQVLMQASAVNDAVAMGMVTNAGHIDTTAAQGGDVNLLTNGGNIRVSGSINATSQNSTKAGGQIIIGRDLETNILASSTDASGAMLTSKGGFVETSGAYLVTTGTRVWAKEWLLDPTNITIAASLPSGTTYTDSNVTGGTYAFNADLTSTILASDIQNSLNDGTSVTLQTTGNAGDNLGDGNIAVNASINKTLGSAATLTLRAHNRITLNDNVSISSTSNALDVILNSDFDGNSLGNIVLNNGSSILSNGGHVTLGGGTLGDGSGVAFGTDAVLRNGIHLVGTARILSGAGNISLNANSTNVFNHTSFGLLMNANSRIESTSGNILITALSRGTSTYATGMSMAVGSTVKTGTGNITINSTASNNGTGFAEGLRIDGTIETVSGHINLTGIGGRRANSGNSAGIFMAEPGVIRVTGLNSGSVTLNGIGGTDTLASNANFLLGASPGIFNPRVSTSGGSITMKSEALGQTVTSYDLFMFRASVNSNGGNINLTANSIYQDVTFVSNAKVLDAGTGTVSIQTRTADTHINLGGADGQSGAVRTLGLTDVELSKITAGRLQISNTGTGNITVSSNISSPATSSLDLTTAGNINLNANLTTHNTANALNLIAATGSISGSGNITSSANPSTITINTLGGGILSGIISGSASLVKLGAGITTLTGKNNYSGTTTITYGALQIGNGAIGLLATGNLGVGAVTNNASLIFNRSNTMTVANSISGTGTLNQIGAGTTILTANSTNSGATTISGGTLQLGDGGNDGSLNSTSGFTLSNNATLAFNKSGDTTINKPISGNGNVTANITGDLSIDRSIILAEDGTEKDNTFNLQATGSILNLGTHKLTATNLYMTATGGSIGATNRILSNVDNLFVSANTGAFVTEDNAVTVAGVATNNGSIDILAAGTLTVGTVKSVDGLTTVAVGSGNIVLLANTSDGNGVEVFKNITAGGNVTIDGTTSSTEDAGVFVKDATITANNITVTGTATDADLNLNENESFGYKGKDDTFVAREKITITGTSKNYGSGFYSNDGSFTSATGLGISGNSVNGQGVGFESGVVLINTSTGGISIQGSVDGDEAAVDLLGVTMTNQNGGISLVATKGDILWDDENGVNSITNQGTGEIRIIANSPGGDIDTLFGSVLTITQNGDEGVLIQSIERGFVSIPTIIDNGAGDVRVAAGSSIGRGISSGGQVKAEISSSIDNDDGYTRIYSGAINTTGRLHDVHSSFEVLAFEGSGIAPNAKMNAVFGESIAIDPLTGSPKVQVLFRQNGSDPGRSNDEKFDLNLSNISKVYGSPDFSGSGTLNDALKTAYDSSTPLDALNPTSRPVNLSFEVNGNRFEMLASKAISELNVGSATRVAGETVNNGTPYLYSGITAGAGVRLTSQPGLVITPKPLTITANAITGTYNGATYNALATTAGVTSVGLVNATVNGVVINDSILAVTSTFNNGALNGSNIAQAGSYTRTISNAVDVANNPLASNYDITYVGSTLQIDKANITAIGSMVFNNTNSFNGLSFTSITGVNNETFTVRGAEKLLNANVQTNQQLQSIDNLILTGVSGASLLNYNTFTTSQTSVSVTPATLTFTAQSGSKLITKPEPVLTYGVSGLVNGDTSAVINPTISRVAGEAAGVYNITMAGASASSNYTINYVNSQFTILGAQTLLITMQPITTTYGTLGASVVTSAEYAKSENNVFQGFFKLTNIGNNVWTDNIGGSITILPTLNGVSAISNVGIYQDAVTNTHSIISNGTVANPNFISVFTQKGNYTVNAAPLSISANAVNRVYDATAFNSPSATASGFVNGQNFATLGGLNFTGDAINSINAGTYTLNATANSNPNNNYIITYTGANLVTAKAALSVTGNSLTTPFNGQQHSVTGFEVTGFVGTDSLATMSGISALGATGNSAGSYINVVNVMDQLNYRVIGSDGLLKITASGQVQPDPFVNPVTPKPIPPIDPTSTTGTGANTAGSFQLARNVRLYAPDQCSDNTGLEAGLETDINNENCECQKALFNDESLCKVVAEESGPEFLSAVTSLERSNTH